RRPDVLHAGLLPGRGLARRRRLRDPRLEPRVQAAGARTAGGVGAARRDRVGPPAVPARTFRHCGRASGLHQPVPLELGQPGGGSETSVAAAARAAAAAASSERRRPSAPRASATTTTASFTIRAVP